ncbi:MAG: hypothetical protein ACOYOA_02760 [Saprospiraceae bacterium]
MKHLVLILLFPFLGSVLFAQQGSPVSDGNFFPWHSDDPEKELFCLTLISSAVVHSKPDMNSKVISRLPIATKVKIEQVTVDTMQNSGFSAPWCVVSYEQNGKTHSGYLWGGDLAFVSYEINDKSDSIRNGLIYLAGVQKVEPSKKLWTLQVVVVRNNTEIGRTEIETEAEPSYFASFYHYGNLNYTNVIDVLEFKSYYPANGYASSENLLFFTEKKLLRVLETSDISDTNIYDSQDYLLSADKGGIQNHVLVVNNAFTVEEVEKEKGKFEQVTSRHKFSIHLYKWDGLEMLKINEIK